jgi:hypothetical protein
MNYAIIENETVTNIIVAETEEIAKAVTGATEVISLENSDIGIGWIKVDGTWSAPEPIYEPENAEELIETPEEDSLSS